MRCRWPAGAVDRRLAPHCRRRARAVRRDRQSFVCARCGRRPLGVAMSDAPGQGDGVSVATGAALRVRHLTRYEYDAPVELAHHLAHLRPRDTALQTVRDWRIEVQPEPDGERGAIDASVDVFGN